MAKKDARALPRLIAVALPFLAIPASAALSVSSDFENGSARVLALDEARQTVRISPAGDEARGWPNWWYFRLEGIEPSKPLTVEVEAREAFVPMDRGPKKVLLNPSWALPAQAAYSTDGKTWKQTSAGQRHGSIISYRLDSSASRIWLAWGPPFAPADAAAFVARMAREHPFASGFILATSIEGRRVPALRISDNGAPSNSRPAIWVVAREHAWECGSTWVGVGLAEWLAGSDPAALRLRRNADFFFVPIMDVDHVATGDGGKVALPQDHNRDWSESPHWPEVAGAQQRIQQLAHEGRMAVFLDLHNPSPAATQETFYVQHPPYLEAQAVSAQERFLEEARQAFGQIRMNDEMPPEGTDLRIWRRIAAPWVSAHGNPGTLSLTIETPWNTPKGTIDGYQRAGAKLGLALAGFFDSSSQ